MASESVEQTMRAVVTRGAGGPDLLEMGRVAKPVIEPDELLVRVHATALNRADLMQREGKYPPPEGASPVLGLEMAGIVEEVGSGSAGWDRGERVCGLLPGGGYAEYAAIHHEMAMRLPEALSFEEGAAIPEVFLTAFQALHWYGDVQNGSTVLVHAGASGVGTAAIQLARAVGATVFVTASRGKHAVCRALGAAAAIDYKAEDFADRVAELTDGEGADVIVDFIGAPYFAQNLQSLAVDGRLILLATMGGSWVEGLDLRAVFAKRASVFASTLRSRDRGYKIRLTCAFLQQAFPLFETGELQPIIDRVLPWTEVAEAHRIMGANRNVGKIILKVD